MLIDAIKLINERLDYLQEKEITKGLSNDEQTEIGKLYIATETYREYEKKANETELAKLKIKHEELKNKYELLISKK